MQSLLPYHKSDYRQLPKKTNCLALRGAGLTRDCTFFFAHTKMKSPAVIEKYKQGPVGMMTLFPSGPPVMAKFLGLWFVYCLIIGFFVAYLTAHTVASGATYRAVFRVAGSAAFMAYGLGSLSNSIWKGQPWSMTAKEVIDGLVYGLLMAGTFGWLWPR
jgi:hypothetical protein